MEPTKKGMGDLRDKYLADGGRRGMSDEKRALVKENVKAMFSKEGIPWNRETLKGYIAGLNFSLANDCIGEDVGSAEDSIEKAKLSTEVRKRAFNNICIMYSILDDWNIEVEKHMSTIAI